ncbi:MAG: ATP-binding protein [Polyangiaceae bacterium]|nr:ATP-binding protein [Polyangiaceae bacterium]
MNELESMLNRLGERYGVLAESSTSQLTVIARNVDVAIGDLFLLPCRRGPDRFYVFRTTEYANVLNRSLEMNDIARNKLTMPDSYFAEDLADERLVELHGMVLGYAEQREDGGWVFRRPRRLPQHLTDVYRVDPDNPGAGEVVRELLASQLGQGGLFIGHLLAGERPLTEVPVYLPIEALSHHIGVFGRTGCGKSNLIMLLLDGVLAHNRQARERGGRRASVFAIDPHDEFRTWHAATGGADGIRGIVGGYSLEERADLVAPFYYLSARDNLEGQHEARVRLSRADVTPEDLIGIIDFSEQQVGFARQLFGRHGERWIGMLFSGDLGDEEEGGAEYLPGTIAAVERRLGFLAHGQTRLVSRFDPDMGLEYESSLPDILCALERGRVLVIDTTLLGELEQFLLNTVVARALFHLRRALRLSDTPARLRLELATVFGRDDAAGRLGQTALVEALLERLDEGMLPYLDGDRVRSTDELPVVHVLVEEAPSILNPQRLRFGSVFRDISRQGRKFGIGLGVVSQQVSEIDRGVLTQLNTQLAMVLGNADERREAVKTAATDIGGFASELQVLDRGQLVLSTSLRDIAVPIQVPAYYAARNVRRTTLSEG